ncbi:MAG: hypothetical protein GX837_12450 [Methanomicrobiales archaeon]|nr:hypothetical protein [Methanomicrobiales archaeon]
MTICGCWEHYHPPPQVYDPATDLQMIRHEVEEILRTQQAISSRLDRLAAVTPGVRELRAGVQPLVPRTHESRFRALEFPAEEDG